MTNELTKEQIADLQIKTNPRHEGLAFLALCDMALAYLDLKADAQVADKARREGLQRAINLTCTYCADGREIIDRGDGGIWHFVARGDDLGDTEPCTAHKLYRALQSRKTDGVG